MADEVRIHQFEDNDGNKVAPLTPERAIYDTSGVRLDQKLEGLGLDAIKDAQEDAINKVNAASDTLNKNVGIPEYPTFSTSKSYSTGDIVKYTDGLLYKFTTNHAAGNWNASEVESTSLKSDIDEKVTELEIRTTGKIYSSSSKELRVYSDNLKIGTAISVELVGASESILNISAFLFYGEGSSDYDTIGNFKEVGQKHKVNLEKDYIYIKVYDSSVTRGEYSVKVSIDSLTDEIDTIKETEYESATRIGSLEEITGIIKVESYKLAISNYPQINYNIGEDIHVGDDVKFDVICSDYIPEKIQIYNIYTEGPADLIENPILNGTVFSSGVINVKSKSDSKTLKAIRLLFPKISDNTKSVDVKIHINTINYYVEQNNEKINKLEQSNDQTNSRLDRLDYYTVGKEFTPQDGARALIIYSDLLKKGNTLRISLVECSDDSPTIAAFLYKDTSNYDEVGYFKKVGDFIDYKIDYDYVSLKFYNNISSGKYKIKFSVNGLDSEIEDLKNNIGTVPVIKALILGNSYSQNGGNWIRPMMSYLPDGSSWISLAVSSATVRDKQKDRITYPYTSRPVSSNNSGNLNTLACQIEKLKRLMQGTDLDEGESKLYASPDEYPNAVIIEGGMNDVFDSDEVESTYFAQFEKKVDSAYIKQTSSKEAVQGSCYVQTPIEEVNRTCFAGAYRYLVQSILEIFPNAQIFITTASGLGYWNNSVVEKRYKTAEQQRKCANLCAATVIDWSADGQINSIVNHPSGSGTEEDPYIWGEMKDTGYNDTGDLMHPNVRGGKKYGKLAALVIKQRFMDIGNL